MKHQQEQRGTSKIRPVILCGGAGTRLWPLSTAATPKQLLALTGDRTLLQETVQRVVDRTVFSAPMIVTAAAHEQQVREQLGMIGCNDSLLIVEPAGRNTAAAICLAALAAEPNELMLVMPSDHVIGDIPAFHQAVVQAVPFALQGRLVTFGIRPTRPETGFGYIRRGSALGGGVFAAERFVEKPDLATARVYVEDGRYDWNGGIFLFRVRTMLDALEAQAPDILETVAQAIAKAARRPDDMLMPDAALFGTVRSQSIDYAVMERADGVAVVPVDMNWSDVGSWDALLDLSVKDDQGNHACGPVTAVDTRNSLLRSEGPRVVTVGVDDLLVIATADTVLILRKGESQRVKEALEQISG